MQCALGFPSMRLGRKRALLWMHHQFVKAQKSGALQVNEANIGPSQSINRLGPHLSCSGLDTESQPPNKLVL